MATYLEDVERQITTVAKLGLSLPDAGDWLRKLRDHQEITRIDYELLLDKLHIGALGELATSLPTNSDASAQ